MTIPMIRNHVVRNVGYCRCCMQINRFMCLKIPMARAKVDRLEAGRRGGSCPTISLGTTTPEKIMLIMHKLFERKVCALAVLFGA